MNIRKVLKHPYPKLIISMLIIGVSFGVYSLSTTSLKLAGYTIKKIETSEPEESNQNDLEAIINKNKIVTSTKKDSLQVAPKSVIISKSGGNKISIVKEVSTLVVELTQEPLDTSKQMILLIGDSMQEGLRFRLQQYCQQNGNEMVSVIWYSSSSHWYGNCDTLSFFIKKFKPTLVLLSLGANELFVNDLKKRDKYVKNIVNQMNGTKFIWIGPPNWKKDTGINEIIRTNVGDCRYFPSKNLTLSRAKDGAHPTKAASKIWMDSVATFIKKKSCYPIKMETPISNKKLIPHTIILKPNPPSSVI